MRGREGRIDQGVNESPGSDEEAIRGVELLGSAGWSSG